MHFHQHSLIKNPVIGNLVINGITIVSKIGGCNLKKSTVKPREKVELLTDDQTWINILEPELCKDAAAAECLARLLFVIKKEINSGSEGVKRASRILSEGIEAIYLYTNAHKAALKLYVLSLEGELKPQDEPLNLISAAIERSKIKR
jgi:hypothetical protein